MQETIYGYAKHRKELGLSGGTRGAVQKAIKTGRITKGADGKINVARADRDWEQNLNQRKRHQTPKPSQSIEPGQAPETPEDETFLEAQRQHEWLKVQKEEMELRLRKAELLERSQVKEEVSKMLTTFKNKMLYIPSRISQKLGAVTDDRERRSIIETEIKEALSSLSEYEPDAA